MKGKSTIIALGLALAFSAGLQAQTSDSEQEVYTFERQGKYLQGYQNYYERQFSGQRQTLVFDGDDVYYTNPVINFIDRASVTIKGKLVDGYMIEFEFPQKAATIDGVEYVVERMKCTGGSNYHYVQDDNNAFIFFLRDENGGWQMEDFGENASGCPNYVLGIYAPGRWEGFAEWETVLTPLNEEYAQVPEGVEISSEWILKTDNRGIQNVQVAIDGNDFYLGGINKSAFGFVKGTLENGKVTFPSKQFIETDSSYTVFAFMGATVGADNKAKSFTDKVVFDYDEATHTLSSTNHFAVNIGSTRVNAYEVYVNPTLKWQDPNQEIGAPADPELLKLEPYDPLCFYGYVSFRFPNYDVNGVPMDTSRLYFNYYVDDELFTFTNSDFYCIIKDTTDLPYGFNDGGMEFGYFPSKNGLHQFHFKFDGAETMGIQTFYLKEDGTKIYSNLITEKVGFGTNSVSEFEAEVVATEYLDLSGAKVVNPERGTYVKVETLSNGAKRTGKVVLK